MDTKTTETMALEIPEDLVVLFTLDLTKLGEPEWKVQKQESGYSVSIFWRIAEKLGRTTPLNAHYQGGECVSHRKQCSQRRLQGYLERKRKSKEEETDCITGNPAGWDRGPVEPGIKLPATQAQEDGNGWGAF